MKVVQNTNPAAVIELSGYRHFRSRTAAKQRDRAAEAIVNECGERLLAHLEGVKISPWYILDAPARLGANATQLKSLYPKATVIELDPSAALLCTRQVAGWKRWFGQPSLVNADIHRLPFVDQSMDMVVSSLCELFAPQPSTIMAEFFRVLKPNGLLTLSALGPDTLVELRRAWTRSGSAIDRIHPFLDLQQIGNTLVGLGFSDVVMDSDRLLLRYASIEELLIALKNSGSGNARYDRCRGLSTREMIKGLQRYYHPNSECATFQVTIELSYAHAWKSKRATTAVAVAPPRAHKKH